jgi:hypothetical protein
MSTPLQPLENTHWAEPTHLPCDMCQQAAQSSKADARQEYVSPLMKQLPHAACDVELLSRLPFQHALVLENYQPSAQPARQAHQLASLFICEVMGGGWSFAFTLIPRTGVQGHTNSLHRTHMGCLSTFCWLRAYCQRNCQAWPISGHASADNPTPTDWWGDPPDLFGVGVRVACLGMHPLVPLQQAGDSGNSTQDRQQDRDISAMCSMLTCDAATAVKPHKKMQLPPGAIASLWRPQDTHQHARPLRDHAKGSATHKDMQVQ